MNTTRIVVELPEGAYKKIMADPDAFIKEMEAKGIPILAITSAVSRVFLQEGLYYCGNCSAVIGEDFEEIQTCEECEMDLFWDLELDNRGDITAPDTLQEAHIDDDYGSENLDQEVFGDYFANEDTNGD